jgi:hypothetical protein
MIPHLAFMVTGAGVAVANHLWQSGLERETGTFCLVMELSRATRAKALIYIPEYFRGFENPLPGLKSGAGTV